MYEISKKSHEDGKLSIKINFPYVKEGSEILIGPIGGIFESNYVKWYAIFDYGGPEWVSVQSLLDYIQFLLESYVDLYGDVDTKLFAALGALYMLSTDYENCTVTEA